MVVIFVTLALRKLRQEDHKLEFKPELHSETGLGYMAGIWFALA